MRFQGCVTLTTGSGSGLGRLLAQRFAAEGAAVVADAWPLRRATMPVPNGKKPSEMGGGVGLSWYLEALKKYAVFGGRSRRKEY